MLLRPAGGRSGGHPAQMHELPAPGPRPAKGNRSPRPRSLIQLHVNPQAASPPKISGGSHQTARAFITPAIVTTAQTTQQTQLQTQIEIPRSTGKVYVAHGGGPTGAAAAGEAPITSSSAPPFAVGGWADKKRISVRELSGDSTSTRDSDLFAAPPRDVVFPSGDSNSINIPLPGQVVEDPEKDDGTRVASARNQQHQLRLRVGTGKGTTGPPNQLVRSADAIQEEEDLEVLDEVDDLPRVLYSPREKRSTTQEEHQQRSNSMNGAPEDIEESHSMTSDENEIMPPVVDDPPRDSALEDLRGLLHGDPGGVCSFENLALPGEEQLASRSNSRELLMVRRIAVGNNPQELLMARRMAVGLNSFLAPARIIQQDQEEESASAATSDDLRLGATASNATAAGVEAMKRQKLREQQEKKDASLSPAASAWERLRSRVAVSRVRASRALAALADPAGKKAATMETELHPMKRNKGSSIIPESESQSQCQALSVSVSPPPTAGSWSRSGPDVKDAPGPEAELVQPPHPLCWWACQPCCVYREQECSNPAALATATCCCCIPLTGPTHVVMRKSRTTPTPCSPMIRDPDPTGSNTPITRAHESSLQQKGIEELYDVVDGPYTWAWNGESCCACLLPWELRYDEEKAEAIAKSEEKAEASAILSMMPPAWAISNEESSTRMQQKLTAVPRQLKMEAIIDSGTQK
eukprot:g803.t1